MRHRLSSLLGLLPLLGLYCGSVRAFELGEPNFETVGGPQSIPDGIVTSLAEDRAGLLWIGTVDGLLRYDGYRFRRQDGAANDANALGRTFIQVLLQTRDARLWIGNYALGVSIYDPATERAVHLRHHPDDAEGLSSDSVRALAEARDGSVWIGTRGGLDRWQAGNKRLEHHRHRANDATSLNHDDIAALMLDSRGALWVGSGDGLNRLRAGSSDFERVPAAGAAAAQLAGQQVTSVLEASDGRVWILTRRGDHCIVDARVDPPPVQCVAAATAGFVRSVGGLVQAVPGEIWLAGADGVQVIDAGSGAELRRIRHDPAMPWSLASNDIRALLLSRSGELWVGGYGGGLQRHDPQPRGVRVLRHSPSRAEGLSDPSITSIIELPDGRIWLGTRGNGIDVLDRGRGIVGGFRPQADQRGALGTGWINAFALAENGDVWVGTSRALYRYDMRNNRFDALAMPESLVDQSIRRLLLAANGTLWIATTRGVGRWSPASPRVEPVFDAHGRVLSTDVNALVEDRDGRIWVGSDDALHTVAPSSVHLAEVISTPDLNEPGVVGLMHDQRGGLWVDTTVGLYRLRRFAAGHAEFDAVSAKHGIGGRAFGANLLEDAQGRIWTHRYVFDPRSDTVQELTRADITDIGTGWFRSQIKTRDGLLLFGASKGLLVIDPAQWRPWDYRPPVVATEIRVNSLAYPAPALGASLELAGQKKGFYVEFAALDYSAPQLNRYQHRLEGFEDEWIDSDADHRSVSYNNLWPGQYRLLVRGSNRRGVFGEQPLEIPVRVLPAYWQTWWFGALLLASVLGLMFALHRWRVALLGRQARRLKDLVRQRTSELSDANERLQASNASLEDANAELSSAHKHLVETKERMVMQEKMASLGALIAGVAHEINTPLGVAVTASSHLKSETNRFRARVDNGEWRRDELDYYLGLAAESSSMVDANLARAAQLVRSFKQVSVDRSLDERRRFDLAKYLPEVLESLRPMWRKRDIRFDLDCGPDLELNSYPGAIAQLVANLIQNALLHAFEEGGTGSMRLLVRADGAEHIGIVFSDDGKGIPSTDIAQIFEPFFTTKRARGGTGLGLHIVFNLVNAKLGGEIDVESQIGAGTRFNIRIPRVAPA